MDDGININDYSKISDALTVLEELLNCYVCKQQLAEPYVLESCPHSLCKKCIGIFLKNECPICNKHFNNSYPDVFKEALIENCNKLRQLLYFHTNENLLENLDDQQVPEKNVKKLNTIETTPKTVKRIPRRLSAPLTSDLTLGKKKRITVRLNQSFPSEILDPVIVKKNIKGETSLHQACIKGNLQDVINLLKIGSNPNVKDNAGWTPLHEACINGNVAIVEQLLLHGALPNIPGMENDTPLHDAVKSQNKDIVKLLLQYGADTDQRNSKGLTPKDLAGILNLSTLFNKSPVSVSPCITESPIYEKIVLLSSGLKAEQKEQLLELTKFLSAKLISDFNNTVTHIILQTGPEMTCSRTLKYLLGILSGMWLLSFHWVEACLENKTYVKPDAFEIKGSVSSVQTLTQIDFVPQRARLNCLNQLPSLLDGYHFYLFGSFKPPGMSKEDTLQLIKVGNGSILHREPRCDPDEHPISVPFHAPKTGPLSHCSHIIIFSEKPLKLYSTEWLYSLPINWLIDSINAFKILDPSKYLD